jgi:cell wall-associated NlpC family hydrolase
MARTSSYNRLGFVALAGALWVVPSIGQAQMAKPFAEFSNSAFTLRDSVVAIARAQLGKRYRPGGTTPERGFDCSGLVKYVLDGIKIQVPRTSREQAHIGAVIPRDTTQLRPGDLLMFGTAKAGVSHVGIYVGNGRYIHASSVAGRVIESPLERSPSPLIKMFKTARRVFGRDSVLITSVGAK